MSDESILASHRYGWSKLEIGTLTFFALVIAVVSFMFFRGISDFGGVFFVIVGVCAVAAVSLFYIGRAKKNSSKLTATLKDGVLEVRGGRLEPGNKVILKDVRSIRWRADELWIMLTPKGDAPPLKIPARLASDPELRALFHSLQSEGVKMSKDVQEVLDYYEGKVS